MSSPSDLVLSWSYRSPSDAGSFRIYRSVGLDRFEPLAELAAERGRSSASYVVRDARSIGSVFELRWVDPDGSERVLKRCVWTPPRVEVPLSVTSVSVAPMLGSEGASVFACAASGESLTLERSGSRERAVEPETPPPRGLRA